MRLPEESEQHASTGDVGTAESSVFGGATAKSAAVARVSYRASSDDSSGLLIPTDRVHVALVATGSN